MNTDQCNIPPHPVSEPAQGPYYVPLFGHFRGFSAPPSVPQSMSSSYASHGYDISDEMISPRMPIPDPSLFRWSPRPRFEELSDESDDVALSHDQSSQHRASRIAATPGSHRGLGRPWTGQHIRYPTQLSPSPEHGSTSEHTPVLSSAKGPIPTKLPTRGAPTTQDPLQPPRPWVHRVPSENEEAFDSSTKGGSPRPAHPTPIAGDLNEVIPIPADNNDDHDRESTVYPHDSVSILSNVASSSHSGSGECLPSLGRFLEDGVVEVHNVCLAATQRYLETRRVNWELRHGCGVTVLPPGGDPVRRNRDRAGERGSPYPRAGSWKRAASEHGSLGHIRGSCIYDDNFSVNDTTNDSQGRSKDKIPKPTSSLLQNTSYICNLMWRRAQRDREDVPGAEICACRNMGFLSECAETIVLHDAGEWERDPERGFKKVCQAGRDLCRELEDAEGMERVDDVEFWRQW